MERGPFAREAPGYWDRGFRVIPTEPHSKEPAKGLSGWPGYASSVLSPAKQKQWLHQYSQYGIGLLTGTPLDESHVLVGIDIDDESLMRCVEAVVGGQLCAKTGKRGGTSFVRSPKSDEIKSTSLRDAEGQAKIDILAAGKYTVMPDSIHPVTGRPYRWLTQDLKSTAANLLPIFSSRQFLLLKTIIGSKHLATIMSGETTHDAGVTFVAQIVKYATDEEITQIFRSLVPADYAGNSLEELSEWIESARRKGFDDVSNTPIDETVALIVERKLHPIAYTPSDGFLRYKNGFWKPITESKIDSLAKKFLTQMIGPKRQVSPMLLNVRRCLALNAMSEHFGERHSSKICVLNGTLDVVSGELSPHSPEHQLRFRLNISYDPAATCPIYENQLLQTLGRDGQSAAVFDEFAALTLVPNMSFQKALFLVGPGGSGKSTLLRIVAAMHDPSAISVTPLDKIDSERYLTNLARKLVCISFDVQTTKKVFGEGFIRITGGDPVATRQLYKEVEGYVVPTVRFMGSMNPDMPGFIAFPDALARRLILLRCGDRVEHPDPNRFDNLMTEQAGIFSRWAVALRRLYARGEFDVPEASKIEVSNYIHQQDAFDHFVAEKLIVDSSAKTPVAEIAREYNHWAHDTGEAELGVNLVGKKLRRAGFTCAAMRNDQGVNTRIVRARIRTRNDPIY